jgi:hypothetical protein
MAETFVGSKLESYGLVRYATVGTFNSLQPLFRTKKLFHFKTLVFSSTAIRVIGIDDAIDGSKSSKAGTRIL